MVVRTTANIDIPAELWARPDLIDILSRRDIAHLFRLVQKVTRASQTQLGMAIGLSQAQVSEIMSGSRRVSSIEVVARIASGLGMPPSLQMMLYRGEHGHATTRAMDVESVQRETGSGTPLDGGGPYADVVAIYPSRSDFTAQHPPHALFDAARHIRAVGLSLNLICQQYADNRLINILAGGATVTCLFLDPTGEAIARQEHEDDYPAGHLRSLTELNIQNLHHRIRSRLPMEARERLTVAVYDETIRANVILIDESLCIAQPYLTGTRGVDSPTMVIRQRPTQGGGLHLVYEQLFATVRERSTVL